MKNEIEGFDINQHEKSSRIINIVISDEIINKLIFPFNKFDLTALEYKPFTRFTIAKSLDDITSNELSKYLNSICCLFHNKFFFRSYYLVFSEFQIGSLFSANAFNPSRASGCSMIRQIVSTTFSMLRRYS